MFGFISFSNFYSKAICTKSKDGTCGFKETQKLLKCLETQDEYKGQVFLNA